MSAGAETTPGERYCPTCERTFFARDRCPDDGTRLVKLTKHDVDLLIGRDLDGRYTIVDKIGKGGMGTVYRATQHGLGREVAIKVVTPSLVTDPVVIKRFLREAKLASRLSHPNAVSVLDFGQTDDGLFYLVMELVKGRTLDTILAEGALTPQRVVRIGSQICDALEGAHALQIIHRDLKPSNVMIMSASRDLVKVLDFGLAKSLHPDATTATMTNAGSLLGTPAFLPPESIGGGAVDGRADLYSLGCILYAATAGRLPFTVSSVPELIAAHATEMPPPLVGKPLGLARVIEKLLAKDPGDRYQDAAAAREALEASLASKDVVQPDEPVHVAESSTMLGWATPVPGVLVPRRTADSAPIARPSADRPRTGENPQLSRPRTGENPPLSRPRTGENPPLSRPRTGENPQLSRPGDRPRTGENPPLSRPRTGENPQLSRPRTGENPQLSRPGTPPPSQSLPRATGDIAMPSPASLVSMPKPDDDDDLMTSSPTLIAPDGIVPIIPKGTAATIPSANPTSLHPAHKTERDAKRPSIAVIVLALLLVAGGAVAAFLLMR